MWQVAPESMMKGRVEETGTEEIEKAEEKEEEEEV